MPQPYLVALQWVPTLSKMLKLETGMVSHMMSEHWVEALFSVEQEVGARW